MTPEEVARSYLASFAGADPDTIAAHVSEDFSNEHASALGASSRGRDEYHRRLPGFLADFDGLRYDVVDLVASDSTVAVAYVLRARHQGTSVEVPGVQWLEIDDGLISRRVDYWDGIGFLRQVGETGAT